jgi:lysophospholipase L1-like esterase
MELFVGWNSRVSGFFRQRELIRRTGIVPALILGILIAAKWCSPDGAPAQPIDSFLLSLHSLETQRSGKVRVLHFGDSHIASDNESSVVRSSLQNRFGDGGPGLMLPWRGPRLYTVNYTYGNTYGWQRSHPTYNSPIEDTGLALSFIEAQSPNQRAWIEATGSEFRVDYLAQPGGGDAEFLLDGASLGQRRMSANSPQLQVARFRAPGPDAPHRFEIRTLDSGPVRILGVSVEKSAPGVVYSALGLVGARAESLLKCREETFDAQIADEQPDLVIMGYGTNESSGSYLDENAYATALSTIIARIHRAAPSALVILLTPPDRGDNGPRQAQHIQTMLREVMSAQRAVAWNEGAIVLDLHTAMGGAGSAEHWAAVQPPLARPDMTHFTNEGYNLLGRYIAGGIMKLYDSGPEAVQSASLEGNHHPGELLPPLFSGIKGAGALFAGTHYGYLTNPQQAPTLPAQIFYFLRNDGQLIVTNDLTTVGDRQGRVISAEQARCVLRGKASPCDNAPRW